MVSRIALLVGLFAAALAATSTSAAPEAEECLGRPKGAAPAGKHWYYNTNRETKRKCWFLADEGAKTASAPAKRSAAPEQPPAAAAPAEAEKETPPAASTHAELLNEQKVEESVASASEPVPDAASAVTVGSATTFGWAVASRWPHESDAFSPGRSAANDPAPLVRAESQSPPALVARHLVPVEPSSTPVGDSSEVRAAAFEVKPPYVVAFVLVAIVLGGVTVMLFASRRDDRREFSSEWEMPQGDFRQREMPWTRAATAAPIRQGRHRSVPATE